MKQRAKVVRLEPKKQAGLPLRKVITQTITVGGKTKDRQISLYGDGDHDELLRRHRAMRAETEALKATEAARAALRAAEEKSKPGRPPRERIVREDEALDILGISRATMRRWMKKPGFPKARKLREGGRAVGWLQSELLEYIRQR